MENSIVTVNVVPTVLRPNTQWNVTKYCNDVDSLGCYNLASPGCVQGFPICFCFFLKPTTGTWMSRWKLGCKWLANGLFHLLINGVYWGYNPLTNPLLTSWDTLVGLDSARIASAIYLPIHASRRHPGPPPEKVFGPPKPT